jgi:hypothetical protein
MQQLPVFEEPLNIRKPLGYSRIQILALFFDFYHDQRFAVPLFSQNIDMLPPELFVSPDFSHRSLIIQEFKVNNGKAAILHFSYLSSSIIQVVPILVPGSEELNIFIFK